MQSELPFKHSYIEMCTIQYFVILISNRANFAVRGLALLYLYLPSKFKMYKMTVFCNIFLMNASVSKPKLLLRKKHDDCLFKNVKIIELKNPFKEIQ